VASRALLRVLQLHTNRVSFPMMEVVVSVAEELFAAAAATQ
jgi:hypothetical protein